MTLFYNLTCNFCFSNLYTAGSAPRLILTALLIFVLNIKSDKEEEMLAEVYPEYEAYKSKVTGKFIPGDLKLPF